MDEEDTRWAAGTNGKVGWWSDIVVGSRYRLIGKKKTVRIEDVHWNKHLVYVSDEKSPDIEELSLERIYEYWERV